MELGIENIIDTKAMGGVLMLYCTKGIIAAVCCAFITALVGSFLSYSFPFNCICHTK